MERPLYQMQDNSPSQYRMLRLQIVTSPTFYDNSSLGKLWVLTASIHAYCAKPHTAWLYP